MSELLSRLANVLNEFSYRYRSHTAAGAVVQLWMPQTVEDGSRVLSTQNAPFVIMGVSDQLTLYRYACSSYKPAADSVNIACPVSQVFADLQPGNTQVHHQVPLEFDRAAEAARCNLHSILLLPIYDADAQSPACVFELAQQERDVDFTQSTQILRDICLDVFLWVPQLDSSAQPIDTCIKQLQSNNSTDLHSCNSSNSSLPAVASALVAAAANCCDFADSTGFATILAAPAGGLAPVVRRCSCLIVEEPDLASFYPIAEDEDQEAGCREALAAPSEQERDLWAQEWQQQQQRSRRSRRRSRRHSLVLIDHVVDACQAGQLCSQQAAGPAGLQLLPPPDSFMSIHPGPLTAHLESPFEEGSSSSSNNALYRSVSSNVTSKFKPSTPCVTEADNAIPHQSLSPITTGTLHSVDVSQPEQQQQQQQDVEQEGLGMGNMGPWPPAGLGTGLMHAPPFNAHPVQVQNIHVQNIHVQNIYVQPRAARVDRRRMSLEQRRTSGSSTSSVMVLTGDGQQPFLLGGSLSVHQAKTVQLGALIGVGSVGRVFCSSFAGQAVAVKVIQHSSRSTDKVAPVAAQLLGIRHPNVVGLHEYITWAPGQSTDATASQIAASLRLSAVDKALSPLIILKDDSSSGQLTQTSSGSSIAGFSPFAETWLLQDYCDAGTLEHQVLEGDAGPFFEDGVPQLEIMLQTLLGVAQGMEELHCREVLHGDLCARNVLLATVEAMPNPAPPGTPPALGSRHAAPSLHGIQLVPRVADAGLSRICKDLAGAFGSVTHQPPELLLGQRLSMAADVWSFGVLMWEVVMAEPPWLGFRPGEVMNMVAVDGERLQFSLDVPEAYQAIARACWADRPEQRPSFSHLVQQLQELISGLC